MDADILKVLYALVCVIFLVSISACATPSAVEKKKTSTKLYSSQSSQFEKNFLIAVNQVRSKARKCGKQLFTVAPALRLSNDLNKAAHKHSLDMYENRFLEHTSSNGDTIVERMQAIDYSWKAVGENIAHNQKTIGQVIEDWLSSPGHCSNLMSADYTETGIAQVNWYWTQVYARPK